MSLTDFLSPSTLIRVIALRTAIRNEHQPATPAPVADDYNVISVGHLVVFTSLVGDFGGKVLETYPDTQEALVKWWNHEVKAWQFNRLHIDWIVRWEAWMLARGKAV